MKPAGIQSESWRPTVQVKTSIPAVTIALISAALAFFKCDCAIFRVTFSLASAVFKNLTMATKEQHTTCLRPAKIKRKLGRQ